MTSISSNPLSYLSSLLTSQAGQTSSTSGASDIGATQTAALNGDSVYLSLSAQECINGKMESASVGVGIMSYTRCDGGASSAGGSGMSAFEQMLELLTGSTASSGDSASNTSTDNTDSSQTGGDLLEEMFSMLQNLLQNANSDSNTQTADATQAVSSAPHHHHHHAEAATTASNTQTDTSTAASATTTVAAADGADDVTATPAVSTPVA